MKKLRSIVPLNLFEVFCNIQHNRPLLCIITDDALFSTGTGLEHVGVVGLDQDY